jgi:hypothetical protein
MGMQYDVSSASNTASATFFAGPARLKGIYFTGTANAGAITFRDGGSSGTTKLVVNSIASASAPTYILVPGEGVRFSTDLYVGLNNVASVTVFYG